MNNQLRDLERKLQISHPNWPKDKAEWLALQVLNIIPPRHS